MAKYVMAMDAGTTSNRCILFDRQGKMVSVAQKEFPQYFPKPGWVEHDANEIWSTMLGVAVEAMQKAGASAENIAAIGITNQRETTIVWDRYTGEPVCNAIVWQCRRTAQYCDTLKEKGLVESFREKTGLVIDAYFSATKLKWILDHVPQVRERAKRGDLLFGTVETWLIWKMTRGKVHVTDYTNASRTMLFNIRTLQWDEEILRELEIPSCMLPEVKPSSCIYGTTDPSFFGGAIPIAGAAGDQQAALFGQTCFLPGEAKNTYGTGCFLLMNTGEKPVFSTNGLVTTIAWGIGDQVCYALEGSIFVGGAAIQWLRDEMKLIESAPDSEYMAGKVADTNGCYVVPAFTGLGAPYWDPYARGTILGLTRGVNKYHIIRATLEAITYEVQDVLEAMEADSGMKLSTLKVDGGASANNFLMQCQADISHAPVSRPCCIETTAMGAAYLAGLAVGYWPDQETVKRNWAIDRTFLPGLPEEERMRKIFGWHRAVRYAAGWAKEE
ncbi:MAG: glycerol kinase GlpK [Fusicatenibacter sp.]|nr:glycerol kinase GlpK [Fusicatenibacter sp.]